MPVLSLKQFPGALSDKAVQPIGFQPPVSLVCKNEKAKEIAFVGLLMKVAAVPILRPGSSVTTLSTILSCVICSVLSHVLPTALKLESGNSRSARVYWRARSAYNRVKVGPFDQGLF